METCKSALEARKEELKLCNLGLRQSTEQNAMLRSEIENKDSQLRAWYRNPFFMVAVGLVVGVAVTR